MIRSFLRILFCLFLTFAGVPDGFARNSEKDSTLAPVVVSASKIPAAVTSASGSATVINRDQIEAKRAGSMVEILRQVPGLHIDQLGGRGGLSSVYLRGCDPNYTLVMIDGVKVNDPTNARGGSFDFSTLGVENVERVEVVRSPLSSVHGSDAICGVINVVMRHGTPEPEYAVTSGVGPHGYYSGGIEARGPVSENADYALSAGYTDNGNQVRGDEYKGRNVFGKVTMYGSDALQIQGVVRFHGSHSESFPEDSGGPEFAVLQDVDVRDAREFTAGMEANHKTLPWLDLTVKGSWYDREETTVSPGVAPGVRDPFGIPGNAFDNRFTRAQVSAGGVISAVERLKASVGVDAEFESGESDSAILFFGNPVPGRFEMNREVYSPYLEMLYAFDFGMTVTGGIRADMPENFDTEYSPRFGAVYSIESTGTTFRVNWSKGFKLPSFFALSNPIVGNSKLRPETSKGFDFGITQNFFNNLVSVSATPFYSKMRDVIDLDEGPPPMLVNRSEVTAQGVEFEVDVRPLENLALSAHLTYTHTDIEGTEEELRNRPEWRGGINVHWRPRSEWGLNMDFLYVGEALDSSIPTGDRTLDDYSRVNVAVSWSPKPYLEAALAIDNLFDQSYHEAIGFPAPGIQPRVSATIRF